MTLLKHKLTSEVSLIESRTILSSITKNNEVNDLRYTYCMKENYNIKPISFMLIVNLTFYCEVKDKKCRMVIVKKNPMKHDYCRKN